MSMEMIRQTLQQLIPISEPELDQFLAEARVEPFAKQALLSEPGKVPASIFFINRGILRLLITDQAGKEHTTHFALEGQFIADYASFIQRRPSLYALQALEPTEVVVLPRASIDWGYAHLQAGEQLGRLVAEYYFIYLDQRIIQQYGLSPRERYDHITELFPNIHNRVPQHMIASYLGITPVHLSRLKRGS